MLVKSSKVVSGKWMIFCKSCVQRQTWITIANAAVCGELRSAVEMSTISEVSKQHVICVYTEDFTTMGM
ncbi:DUF1917 domain-containing protein [archaeon]|nr:MAG: DUF1917 domain-containing protein [archaeon]